MDQILPCSHLVIKANFFFVPQEKARHFLIKKNVNVVTHEYGQRSHPLGQIAVCFNHSALITKSIHALKHVFWLGNSMSCFFFWSCPWSANTIYLSLPPFSRGFWPYPVNEATLLIQPIYFGPSVTALMMLHCIISPSTSIFTLGSMHVCVAKISCFFWWMASLCTDNFTNFISGNNTNSKKLKQEFHHPLHKYD